jgi:F0F1-type ATP synthase assembly protein I
MKKWRPSNPASTTKNTYDYGKYAGMALQMGITITLGVWGGSKLDEYFTFAKFPLFTVVFSLLAVIGSMFMVIKSLLKK